MNKQEFLHLPKTLLHDVRELYYDVEHNLPSAEQLMADIQQELNYIYERYPEAQEHQNYCTMHLNDIEECYVVTINFIRNNETEIDDDEGNKETWRCDINMLRQLIERYPEDAKRLIGNQ